METVACFCEEKKYEWKCKQNKLRQKKFPVFKIFHYFGDISITVIYGQCI